MQGVNNHKSEKIETILILWYLEFWKGVIPA